MEVWCVWALQVWSHYSLCWQQVWRTYSILHILLFFGGFFIIFFSSFFLSLSVLYYFETWPTFFSLSSPSLFCPIVICFALLWFVLFCWLALFVCYMFWFSLLSTVLSQLVIGVCVREKMLTYKNISSTYDIALSHCTTVLVAKCC